MHRIKYDFCCTATFLIKLVRVGTECKIISFECIYNNDDLATLANSGEIIVFRLKCPRENYKCLAFNVEMTKGHKMDENLPGWDRPEGTTLVLDEAWKWVMR